MSLEKFLQKLFEGGRFLKPTIDNQLDHVIIVVHLAMADIDTYEFNSMAHARLPSIPEYLVCCNWSLYGRQCHNL